jgi:hypothetical protein
LYIRLLGVALRVRSKLTWKKSFSLHLFFFLDEILANINANKENGPPSPPSSFQMKYFFSLFF